MYNQATAPRKAATKITQWVHLVFTLAAPLIAHDTSTALVAGTNEISTTQDVTRTAHSEIHGSITNQRTSGSGSTCGGIDHRLVPVTADANEDNYTTETRFDDSGNEDSGPTIPIAQTDRQTHDLVAAIQRAVLEPRPLEVDQGTNPSRSTINNRADNTVPVDGEQGVHSQVLENIYGGDAPHQPTVNGDRTPRSLLHYPITIAFEDQSWRNPTSRTLVPMGGA